MTCFILIRHGDTLWTEEKRYQGTTDTSLSARGREKITALAKTFKHVHADAMYISCLKRAKESGQIVAKTIGLNIKEDARLNEINFGRWEGKTAQELSQEGDRIYQKWAKGRWVTAPEGESVYSLKKRVNNFLNYCLRRHRDQRVVIVSHGGTIRMMLLQILKLPLKYMFNFRVDPASITVVQRYSNQAAQLMCLNRKDMEPAWMLKK